MYRFMKTCASCKNTLEDSKFYIRNGKPKGYCIECCKLKQSEWAIQNRERKLAINFQWRKRNPIRRAMILKASNTVSIAIRTGKLVRGTKCEHCGSPESIQAAHFDYSRLLDVKWLCIKCHRKWDSNEPKTFDKFSENSIPPV